jgi:ribosomal-protein-alanine N-acetyltransferase
VSSPLHIRRLSYSDLPQVISIERRAFPTPWSLAMFVLELSKPSGICLAALQDDRLVGYLVCSRYDTVRHLMNIAVDVDVRRRGIGSTLLGELFARGDSPGQRYTLEVRTSNAGAMALYAAFGFEPAGHRRGYYHDNREDAVIMWRTARTAGASSAAAAGQADGNGAPAAPGAPVAGGGLASRPTDA